MSLTEFQIQNGFWIHNPEDSFPPGQITYPEAYIGNPRLNLVCTQLSISDYQQRKLVKKWCELLPTLSEVRYLWFNSRVSQALFEAACQIKGLEGIYVDWGGIYDLSPLRNLNQLKFLSIGSSPSVESIELFNDFDQLTVLHIENFKKIRDISPIGKLSKLEGLAIEGSMWTTQVIDSLRPLAQLRNLRYLFMANLQSRDGTLSPICQLKSLVNFRSSFPWPKSEFKLLQESLPNLKYGSPFDEELIEQFGKAG